MVPTGEVDKNDCSHIGLNGESTVTALSGAYSYRADLSSKRVVIANNCMCSVEHKPTGHHGMYRLESQAKDSVREVINSTDTKTRGEYTPGLTSRTGDSLLEPD